ncbi:MAG: hypothetical protein P8O06_07795 [Porticoccaceae bacterium]|nr:hypothetical protein [Porticoccaceae bacterium]
MPKISSLLLTLLITAFFATSLSLAGGYNRDAFGYLSYKPTTSVGFYTGTVCDYVNIDHLVSLKDAYESGAASWSTSKKKAFANDRFNHVPACSRVNSSKGSAGPHDFLRRSKDGRGLDYKILHWCDYVNRYQAVKIKYGLSFEDNHEQIFAACE